MTGFLALGALTAKRMAPPQQAAGARGAAAERQQWLRPQRLGGGVVSRRDAAGASRRRAADRTGRGFADDVGDGVGNARDAKHSPSPGLRVPADLWLDRSFHHADGRDAELPEIEPTKPMAIIQPTDLGTHSPTADPTNRGAR
jgi:hypothetical protein